VVGFGDPPLTDCSRPTLAEPTGGPTDDDVHERDRVLFERYRDPRDPLDRELLVERLLPLARGLAARYRRTNEPFDDLYQVACMGLLKAIDRFDADRGSAFSSYAVPTIMGELRRYFRDKSWPLRVYRNVKELALEIDRVTDEMTGRLGRAPSLHELACEVDAGEGAVLEAVQAGAARHAVSLQLPRHPDRDDEETLGDTLGCPEVGYVRTEEHLMLQGLLRHLTRRQREVLRLRYEEDLSQKQIGLRVGLSQMQVSRVLQESLQRLQEVADDQRPATPHAQAG
jgi:RNA polymerase sigma-B factor